MHRASSTRRSLLAVAAILLLCGCRALFPVEAGEGLAHFVAEAPERGAPLPDVAVYDVGGDRVNLRALATGRPVVLQLGSHSCPVYRFRRHDMNPLRAEYAEHVSFVTLYTVEAHPAGSLSPYRDSEWNPLINRVCGVNVPQPRTVAARIEGAEQSADALGNDGRILIDSLSNSGWRALGRAPSAAFVFDREGKLVLAQPWVEPDGIRDALNRLLSGKPLVERAGED